ncbi:hypothetical protein RVW73_000342 [Enterobacter asburiae]|nr:hypothetical protein [Enterobacter asburiae]
MMFFSRFQAVIGGLLFLTCGQAVSATSTFPVTTVSMPAWNIITDTLIKMAPLVNRQQDDGVMALVCDLARGDKTQKDIEGILLKRNINLQALAKDTGAVRLLVNRDLVAQQTACTAYLIYVLFTPVDNSSYMQEVQSTEKRAIKSIDTANKDDKKFKSGVDSAGKTSGQKVFNQARFDQDVRTHIAVALATAQLYALLAGNLERIKGESWEVYQSHIQQMVREYAPNFLNTVKVFYQAENATPLFTQSVTQHGYTVIDGNNHQLFREQNSLLLRSHNVEWLGNGFIMGKQYFVELKILDAPVKKEAVLRVNKKDTK